MDRELGPELVRRRKLRRIAVGLAIAGAVAVGLFMLPAWLRPTVDRARLLTGTVDRGPVAATIEASGTVLPAFERAISSPLDTRVERILKQPGATVHTGDAILELDTAAPRLDLERLADRLAQKQAERDAERLEIEKARADLASRIQNQELDVQLAQYRLTQKRKLADQGLVSEDTLKEAEVQAEKSKIALQQLRAATASTNRSSDARLRALGLEIEILRKERTEAARQLELATARADRDGVVTWVPPEEGATVHRGDVIARIADLASFRVEGSVSDVHSSRLAQGQPARVLIDDATLTGKVSSVDPTIENGVVHFYVALDQPSDARLRNNLRVDVLVETDRVADALRLPRGAYAQGGQIQRVFVVNDGHAIRHEVRIGITGHDHFQVLEGLQPGDQVILSDMTDYLHLREVRIE